jgi:hypothetical protein
MEPRPAAKARGIAFGIHHGGTEDTEKRFERAKRASVFFSVLSVSSVVNPSS